MDAFKDRHQRIRQLALFLVQFAAPALMRKIRPARIEGTLREAIFECVHL